MDLLEAVVLAIWVMLPAYLPNNVAVLAGGGPPIDGGRTWRGQRLLGDGKTWQGTAAGVAAGVAAAIALNLLNTPASEAVGIPFPTFSAGIALAFPVGALAGDIAASFIKRRSGRARGAPVPLLDQLDFLLMALLLGAVIDPAWMGDVFSPLLVAVVVVLTVLLHLGTNGIAYALGVKDEPW